VFFYRFLDGSFMEIFSVRSSGDNSLKGELSTKTTKLILLDSLLQEVEELVPTLCSRRHNGI